MDDFLDGLSDAERAALEDEDLDSLPDLKELANLEDDDEDDGDEDAGNEGDAETEAKAGRAADAVAEAPGDGPFQVPGQNPDEIAAAISQFQAQRDKLLEDYESGDSDLTYAEHKAALRKLEEQITGLSTDLGQARAIASMNEAYAQEHWRRELEAFKRSAEKEGVNYDKNPELMAAWDRAVRWLASDPANDGQPGKWFLDEGHKMVKARFDVGRGREAVPGRQQARSNVDEAVSARRQKPPEFAGLANVPAAGAEDLRGGEFSHLDGMSGMALERALSKMTPEQQDQYLRG